jgi:hypothetical protein
VLPAKKRSPTAMCTVPTATTIDCRFFQVEKIKLLGN